MKQKKTVLPSYKKNAEHRAVASEADHAKIVEASSTEIMLLGEEKVASLVREREIQKRYWRRKSTRMKYSLSQC